MTKVKKIVIFTMLIGIVAFCINYFYASIGYNQQAVTYIQKINVNGVIMYKFDFYLYFDNIIWTFKNLPHLDFNFVTYEWQNHAPYDISSLDVAWNDFVHNLGLIANFFILLLNLLLLPFKTIGYVIQIFTALIGVSYFATEDNPLFWLLNIGKTLCNLQINYITL